MKIYSNVAKSLKKKNSDPMTEEPKGKKKPTAGDKKLADYAGVKRDDPKYVQFRKEHQAGRSGVSTGFKKTEQYAMNVGPRSGGAAPKASGLKAATKEQMKAAQKMVRPGTGSGAKKRK